MEPYIKIGQKRIGRGEVVFIIAELGINHGGDSKCAKKMIDEAKECGVSAVKLQTYITEKRTPKGSPIYDILKKCELSFNEQQDLIAYARTSGLDIFSTPFDEESVDFLAEQNVSCFKVASFDIVNVKLLEKIASIKKPVIISRGMATNKEIDSALSIMQAQNISYALLHCVSAYPVKENTDLNLSTIRTLGETYKCPIGFSDHMLGIDASVFAVAAGATLLEKHFTLSRKAEGPDHALSTEPHEMKRLVEKVHDVTVMLGAPVNGPIDAEKDILQYRRKS